MPYKQSITGEPTYRLSISSARRDALRCVHLSAYAVGHVNNDLLGAVWFTYSSYFFVNVVKLTPVLSGFVILLGQVVDGICTPLVGLLSDRCETRFGKRMPWFLAGYIMAIVGFLAIFLDPSSILPEAVQGPYFLVASALVNIGYACCQISSMALVNSITYSTTRRDLLISLRNGFTYISSFVVLGVALLLFAMVDSPIW
jgi:Na+/melibiose symporter-like transporter